MFAMQDKCFFRAVQNGVTFYKGWGVGVFPSTAYYFQKWQILYKDSVKNYLEQMKINIE